VSYLAADQFFPEWNVWTQFLEESTVGFKLDALAGSHPIEVTESFVTLQCYDHIYALWELQMYVLHS
jgi:aminopeptidase N